MYLHILPCTPSILDATSLKRVFLSRVGITVMRDKKTGKKIDPKIAKIEQRRAEQQEAEKLELQQRWGRG